MSFRDYQSEIVSRGTAYLKIKLNSFLPWELVRLPGDATICVFYFLPNPRIKYYNFLDKGLLQEIQ